MFALLPEDGSVDRGSDRLPVSECRSLLAAEAVELSDGQVQAVRDQLYALCSTIGRAYREIARSTSQTLTADERDSAEERAAILEFDAKLSRATAERVALATVVPQPKNKRCAPSSTAASRRLNKPRA